MVSKLIYLRRCFPALNTEFEQVTFPDFVDDKVEPSDLLIIDSEASSFAANLNFLRDRFVAVKEARGKSEVVRLAKVSAIRGKKIELASDESAPEPARELFGGRELGNINLPSGKGKSKKDVSGRIKSTGHRDQKSTDREEETIEIQFKQIVGVVTLMMRGV